MKLSLIQKCPRANISVKDCGHQVSLHSMLRDITVFCITCLLFYSSRLEIPSSARKSRRLSVSSTESTRVLRNVRIVKLWPDTAIFTSFLSPKWLIGGNTVRLFFCSSELANAVIDRLLIGCCNNYSVQQSSITT